MMTEVEDIVSLPDLPSKEVEISHIPVATAAVAAPKVVSQ